MPGQRAAVAETSWLGRHGAIIVSSVLGLASTGFVFYFSSQHVEIAELSQQVRANTTAISNLQLTIELNKARRDEQVNDLRNQVQAMTMERRVQPGYTGGN